MMIVVSQFCRIKVNGGFLGVTSSIINYCLFWLLPATPDIQILKETNFDYDEIADVESNTRVKSTVDAGAYQIPVRCPTQVIPPAPPAYEMPADCLPKVTACLYSLLEGGMKVFIIHSFAALCHMY